MVDQQERTQVDLVEGDVRLRDLRREDADEIEQWPHFTEPDLQWANYTFRGKADKELWFRFSVGDPAQLRLAITRAETGEVIGLIGLRHLNYRTGNGTLGIRMSPRAVNRGMGTDSIRALLRHAFGRMGLLRVYLDVVETNLRGRRCYEKVGFSYIGRRVLPDGTVMLDMKISRHEFAATAPPEA